MQSLARGRFTYPNQGSSALAHDVNVTQPLSGFSDSFLGFFGVALEAQILRTVPFL